jgi:hypothetical protein
MEALICYFGLKVAVRRAQHEWQLRADYVDRVVAFVKGGELPFIVFTNSGYDGSLRYKSVQSAGDEAERTCLNPKGSRPS